MKEKYLYKVYKENKKNTPSLEELYIDIENQNKWIRSQFKDNIVSLTEIFSTIEDLVFEVEGLKDEIKDLKTKKEPDPFDAYMDYKLENE